MRNESGSAMIISLLLIVLLLGLGTALLTMSDVEQVIARNDEFSEGAFYAAEAAIHVAIDQIDGTLAGSTQVVAQTTLGNDFVYRSGGRDDSAPQPTSYVGSFPKAGYSIGTSTGYNNSGFVFDVYQATATGTGPRNSEREIEVQIEYGPTSR